MKKDEKISHVKQDPSSSEALYCLFLMNPLTFHQNIRSASVQRDSLRKLHHHRCTLVQVHVEIPAELLGQMSFKLLRSFPQRSVDAWRTGKLEEVLNRRIKNE